MPFSSQAVPVGLVFLGGMLLTVLRRKAGHRKAQGGYPELAQRLGLTYRPSPYRRGVGTLSGEHDGYSIVVDPDEQRRMRVKFRGAPRVDLRSYEHGARAPHGLGTIFSSDKGFDAYFKTRFAAEDERAHIEALRRPSELIEPLCAVRELKELTITQSGVACLFDYGNPPYIPVDVVESLLPALVKLARALDMPGSTVTVAAAGSDDVE